MVDLMLPQYDITVGGENRYDDVLAVEYCVALSRSLESKSVVYVRDGKALRTVEKLFKAREKNREKVEFETGDGDDDGADDETDDAFMRPSDLGLGEESPEVDAFREQLMASFGDGIGSSSGGKSNGDDSDNDKDYRLASLFGDEKLGEGPDMPQAVIKAVREHGLPKSDEDTMIFLSSASLEEMVALRGLLAKYASDKLIIFINCKLDPLPREMSGAIKAYSLLPLVTKMAKSDTNIFADSQRPTSEQEDKPIRVVVLRRYPGDWKIFVDSDEKGFQLALSLPLDESDGNGPTMDVVAGAVTDHLLSQLD